MKIFTNTSDRVNAGSMFFPNMNLLRYLLCFIVIINHYDTITGHNIPHSSFYDYVAAFFVMSGFLMYKSYTKVLNFKKFVVHRAQRILPTYIFIVIFCALGGVFVTSLTFSQYFASTDFWKYLFANLTFLNWLQPTLPGVFDSPDFIIDAVNGSLWTMKVEWVLDLSVPIFIYLQSKIKIRKEILALAIVICSMIVRFILWQKYEATGKEIYEILSRQFFGQASFFYFGMLAYFYLEKVRRYNLWLIIIGFILYVIGPEINYGLIFISPISITFLTIGISVIGVTIKPFIHNNCIAYNIYLIHFPIIQLCVYLGLNQYPVWVSFGTAVTVTVILAYLTNRYIDQRFTRRRTIRQPRK